MFNVIIKLTFFSCIYVNVYCESHIAELKSKFANNFMDCFYQQPFSLEYLDVLRKGESMPDDKSVKCFFACAYKKAGILNENGGLSVENVVAISQKYLSEDPVTLENSKKFADTCGSVNDVQLPEDENGCERAALIYKCISEKAPEYMSHFK